MNINIAKDYSPFVLGRYPDDSDYNGTNFREIHLLPAIYKLINNQIESLTIDFDGTYGCDPSFLEEAFGGAIRALKKDNIDSSNLWKSKITINNSDKAEYLAIQGYIEDAINA